MIRNIIPLCQHKKLMIITTISTNVCMIGFMYQISSTFYYCCELIIYYINTHMGNWRCLHPDWIPEWTSHHGNRICKWNISIYKNINNCYIAYKQYVVIRMNRIVLVYIDYCYMYVNMIDGNNLSKLLYFLDDLPARLMNHMKLVP